MKIQLTIDYFDKGKLMVFNEDKDDNFIKAAN